MKKKITNTRAAGPTNGFPLLFTALSALADGAILLDASHKVVFSNPAMERLNGIEKGTLLINKSELTSQIDTVFQTGKTSQQDIIYTDSSGTKLYLRFTWSLLSAADDDPPLVMGICRETTDLSIHTAELWPMLEGMSDIDKIKLTTEVLQDTEMQFRAFVAASSDMVYNMSADWQRMLTLTGKGFLADTEEVNDSWLNMYIPEEEQPRVLEAIRKAIGDKRMFEMEHQVIQADGSIGWTLSRAIPIFDLQNNIKQWLGTASNITLRNQAAKQLHDFAVNLERQVNDRTTELKESRDRLQSILDTTLIQMSILEAVRDENGMIRDFEIKVTNKELEKETARHDLVGKFYAQEYPGIRETGLFDMIVQTIETGESMQTEYFYMHEGFSKWYSCMFVKLNDGVVATNMDITPRKLAEEERVKNYTLLQQSEELARLGSWDYDPLSGVFSWSDGMFRLFDLQKGTEIEPEIYLRYTSEAGRPAAERVVQHIRKGDSDFMEVLEIVVAGQVKILRLKANVIRNNEGHPIRVLGVDMDVTASHQAEEKIRSMEAQQQQEIFRVTLATQEEERRRISESLHNGLGQILYGIMISLTHLTTKHAVDQPAIYNESKRYSEKLLREAIAESRRISHELMPTILEDFGLKAAINDVCQQLGNKIKFQCHFRGVTRKLDKYLELAVYRTVQELMLNVIKHSAASRASIEVNVQTTEISIKVQDNGHGMAETGESPVGIGLTSIRSKVRLLNGQITITSASNEGTTVKVSIPNIIEKSHLSPQTNL